MKRFFLLLTSFVCGGVIMGLELAASRLLAPTFGYSIYVWGALLSVVMGALALGYFLGGWFIDRKPTSDSLYGIILIAFFMTVFVSIFGINVVRVFESQGMVVGSALATLFVFGVPMTLLAMVSPMVIRLNTESLGVVGVSSGQIYAVSTLGSIAGTFASAFYLIPSFGTKATIHVMAFLLLVVSLAGLAKKKYAPAVGVMLFVLLLPQPSSPNVIYEAESEYSLIRVIQKGDLIGLIVNQDRWSQTTYRKGVFLTGGYWDYFSLGPLMTDVDDVLIIGVAGGGSLKQLKHFYPELSIDAVEIDPKVIEVAKEYFDVTEGDGVDIIIEDGRTFVRNTENKYDLIELDVFSGGPNIPYYMATQEFSQDVYGILNDDGILMVNVLSSRGYIKLSDVIANTLETVFPSVYVVDLGGNQIIVAFKNETGLREYFTPLRNVSGVFSDAANHTLYHTRISQGPDVVFTDDHAPIEPLVHEMLSIKDNEQAKEMQKNYLAEYYGS